jgi:hypothetical protein
MRAKVHLKFLKELRKKNRNQLLKNANSRQIKAVCELSKNCLAGKLGQRGYKLKAYKRQLRYLTNRRKTVALKKRYLLQKGNGFFLPALLSAALPLLASLFKK